MPLLSSSLGGWIDWGSKYSDTGIHCNYGCKLESQTLVQIKQGEWDLGGTNIGWILRLKLETSWKKQVQGDEFDRDLKDMRCPSFLPRRRS